MRRECPNHVTESGECSICQGIAVLHLKESTPPEWWKRQGDGDYSPEGMAALRAELRRLYESCK